MLVTKAWKHMELQGTGEECVEQKNMGISQNEGSGVTIGAACA